MASINSSDAKWRAESDARALMDAEEIIADKKRLRAAKPAISKLVTEKKKAAAAAVKAAMKIGTATRRGSRGKR